MLNYLHLKQKPKEFLAATGLTDDEFQVLLPSFETAFHQLYPNTLNWCGAQRRRSSGAGSTSRLPSVADKLFFIVVYHKTFALQTMHGLQLGLSQPQASYWIHRLLPVLQKALAAMNLQPERDGAKVAEQLSAIEGGANLSLDATERRLQRPQNDDLQREKYSGKKKAHTDKNLLLVNETTRRVVYLSPTVEGKKHDKKLAEESAINYPTNARLTKDTGFQGYEPEGVLTEQPKKKRKANS